MEKFNFREWVYSAVNAYLTGQQNWHGRALLKEHPYLVSILKEMYANSGEGSTANLDWAEEIFKKFSSRFPTMREWDRAYGQHFLLDTESYLMKSVYSLGL